MGIPTTLECIPCFVRQATEAAAMSVADGPRRERLVRRLLHQIADADWGVTPVVISRGVQRTVREETGQADPYRGLKDRMNRVALDLLPGLREQAQRQPDPWEAVVRLAIAGNLLDAGSKARLSPEEMPDRLHAIWGAPLVGSVQALFEAAARARRILYLADNAGEIVLDRLLVEALPAGRLTVAVRGLPVINDATLVDAQTAGIPEIAPVIGNGSDAPGTLLAECSAEFRACFEAADLIIAKGQGNFETLAGTRRPIVHLLTVKCPMVAEAVQAPVGTLVVWDALNRAAPGAPPAGCSLA